MSSPYPGIILNTTGAGEKSQHYQQFASYVLYNALDTMTTTNNFTDSSFTLQNKAGAIACKVVITPPSAEWQQQLVGGYSGSIGPRDSHHALPQLLQTRQARLTNRSSALEKLTPLYASD